MLAPDLFRNVLDNLFDGIYVLDAQQRIAYWNNGAERITGYSSREVVGKVCSDNMLVHVDDLGIPMCTHGCPVAATLGSGSRQEARVFLKHKEGYRVPVWVRVAPLVDVSGAVVGAVESFTEDSWLRDLEEEMRRLRELALLDPLTELGNRRYLESNLATLGQEAQRFGWRAGLLYLDIDNFKQINDRYGHDMGDRVLRTVARTLRNAVRSIDVVGRWGGEEFLVLLKNISEDDIVPVAEKIRRLVESCTIPKDGSLLHVTVSAGASLLKRGETHEELLCRADRLMYAAKAAGRNRVIGD